MGHFLHSHSIELSLVLPSLQDLVRFQEVTEGRFWDYRAYGKTLGTDCQTFRRHLDLRLVSLLSSARLWAIL